MQKLPFPQLQQTYIYVCGATALQSVFAYYGIDLSAGTVIKQAKTNPRYGPSTRNMLAAIDAKVNYNDIEHFQTKYTTWVGHV